MLWRGEKSLLGWPCYRFVSFVTLSVCLSSPLSSAASLPSSPAIFLRLWSVLEHKDVLSSVPLAGRAKRPQWRNEWGCYSLCLKTSPPWAHHTLCRLYHRNTVPPALTAISNDNYYNNNSNLYIQEVYSTSCLEYNVEYLMKQPIWMKCL